MQAREWILLTLVVVVPLIIAVTVTLWSIDQRRYRPKKRARPRPVRPARPAEAPGSGEPTTGV